MAAWPGAASSGRKGGPAPAWQQQPRGFAAAPAPGQQPAVRRTVPPPAAQAAATARQPRADDSTIIVFSTAEKDEIGIRTLVGEYQEEGTNHGRKYYKKVTTIPGHEDISVFLYFWDERDGPSFSGWWFGNQVGGAQVWSRNKLTTMQPPKAGWTIPWDGDVKKELQVMTAAEKQAQDQQKDGVAAQKASDPADGADWESRVQKATEKAADAEIDTNTCLEHAREVLQGDLDDAVVQQAQQALSTQATALAEVQRELAVEGLAAQKAPAPLKAEMMALGQRMRKLQAQVKEELQRLKNSKQIKAQQAVEEEKRAELESKERELEGAHSKQLEEMMPAALEKVDTAEDEVEKVAIAAAPLQIDTADDLRPVMLQAIKETEQRVRAAQAAIGEARRYISGKLSQVGRFVSTTKKQAIEEFTTLQNKLNDAQGKLTPFKTVRQDYEQRVQAKKLYDELSGKLAGAEIEVEKAAMMTAPLGGDSSEGIKETEAALSSAQSALAQTMRLIDSKSKAAEKSPGPLQEEIKTLRERAKGAQEKLDEVRKTVKETQVRIAADTLLKEVSEKVSNAEDELQRMAEAELPFLRGEKLSDMDSLIVEADKVAVRVHSALAEAQTFVARKLVEVARFTEGPAKTVKEEIDMLQKRLEEGRERLQQFRTSTADRKRSHLLEEVEVKVSAAESEVGRMTEATDSLKGIGGAGEPLPEGLTETVEQANLAERAAQASIVVARKYLLQKTAELKKLAIAGSGSGSELGKLQSRVNSMQQDITKLRNAVKEAEEKIRVKQMLSEVAIRLQSAEGEVEKVAAAAVPLNEEQPSAEAVERMEKAMASAQNKLSTTTKLVEVKLKSAQGFLKEELAGMRARLNTAEKKLEAVVSASREQRERLEASELIAQAVEKVEHSDAEVLKAAEAELPFLKGIEVLAASEAQRAIAICESAAASAQKAITNARTFVVQKLVDAKQFSDGPADSTTRELLALQRKLDTGAAKLVELKKDTADRKRRAQMQASGEKISSVEAAVQKLASTMTKFTEDMLDISAEQARVVCEEIAGDEHAAQSAVADAKKFLAQRVQDAKTFAEALRGPATADLSRLQARLTTCQVELARLSKQCTDREQRFVAKKLVQDSQANLEQLQKDIEAACKLAAPLIGEDRAPLLGELMLQSVLAAVQAHAKKESLRPEAVWEMVTKGKSAKPDEVGAFLDRLQELTGREDACFTEEQKAQVFKLLGGKSGKLSAADFQLLLRDRQVCRSSVTATEGLDGGKELDVIEIGEGIEVIEPKEDKEGNKRAMCVITRNGNTAFVTLSSKDGLKNFKPSPPYAGKVESIEAHITAVHGRCTEAAEAADKKTVEVSSVKQGPLSEIKAQLLQLRTKFSAEQSKIDTLKKRAVAAKAAVVQQRKEEVEKVQVAKCKAFAEKSVKEVTQAVEQAEAKASQVMGSAKLSSDTKPTIQQLEGIKSAADDALQSLSDAKAVASRALDAHEALKGSARNMILEARVELTKLTSRATATERKLRTATEAVRTAYLSVVKTATKEAREALRKAARQLGKNTDAIFQDASGGKGEISATQFSKFVSSLKGHTLTKEQVELVYKEFGKHGLRKPAFSKILQEYAKCEKESIITGDLKSSSATVRKLEQGELFEILEGPAEDKEAQLVRVRGRALRDGAAGWVTLKGNTGAAFLKSREKPFLWAARKTSLLGGIDEKSSVVRELIQDEVLELLEGPRAEDTNSEVHLKCKACMDGKSGWATIRDLAGATYAAQGSKVYVCRSTIAMTDVFDIQKCKVVRKVDIGEALVVVEEAQDDSEKAIKRLKFRGARDGMEGWVTLKGNHGTVYVEPSNSHYVVQKPLHIRAAMAKGSAAVSQLEAGMVVEGLEAPKEVMPEAKMRIRAKCLEDGKVGWVAFVPGPQVPLKPWTAKYTCKAKTAVTAELAKTSGAVRQTEVGETFEAVEGPTLDKASGLLRIKCASEGVIVGWATVRAEDGTALLEP